MGLFMLLISFYLFVTQMYFVFHATAFEAPIVEVKSELVPKGKGSVFGYVPVVEITDESGAKLRVKVETYDAEPTFRIGEQMPVLCELASRRCITNTFVEKWGNFILIFLLSLVFIGIPAFYYGRPAP